MLGASLSAVGMGAQGLAVGLELYKRTSDPFILGLVGLTTAAPMMLLILPAGYIADRMDRRRIVGISMVGACCASVGLAVASAIVAPVWVMFALLFLGAAASTMGRPARTALLPQLVPKDIFENAVAWRTSVQQLCGMAGPALGGFIAVRSITAVYVFSACAALGFVVVLPFMRVARIEDDGKARDRAFGREILAGVRFVGRTRLLLATMSLDLFAVLLGGAVYLLPVFALDILNVGEQGLGWLRAMPAAGAFAMALLLAHLPPMKHAGRNLLLAVAGFGAVTIVFGLTTNFWIAMAMLFLTGVFDNVSVVVRHTLMQLLTPDAMRGRVSAVSAIFIGSSNELGGFESGLVARLTTPVISVVAGGIGTLVVVAGTAFASPRLRRFGALADARAEDLTPSSSD
ncbi:MFS transporter [Candidatus Poribacteria bacterium]|jgi:MFS family permease|nr:MFS transporter [Candidatus Poribacteria bacterium]MBT5531479.1 MFS transporter [Candidatus Poribacteria bacterium]MBT5710407.1 MFS transporter [Candidatus Poribacteria bacterium]MBT7099890.1 MFS transporter [Candidatus Poribacteria bacterium]MBT7806168.1 MFS transporter [Candidatus Poribacteria bacterium]